MTAIRHVLVVGRTNFDVTAQSDRLPAEHEKLRGNACTTLPGGAAANTAVGLVRQGCIRPDAASPSSGTAET
jgi:ribokinase